MLRHIMRLNKQWCAIKNKKRDMLSRGIIFFHDNARLHVFHRNQDLIMPYNRKLGHFTLDLALSFVPALKKALWLSALRR